MPRNLRKALVLALLVAAAGVAVAGGAYQTERPSREPATTAPRVQAAAPQQVYGLGTVEAKVLSRVGFEPVGRVAAVLVDHGDRVRAGQALAHLESGPQQARLDRAEAQRKQAAAAVVQARAEVTRAEAILSQRQATDRRKQALVKSGTVPVEVAEEAHTEVRVAAAQVDLARAAVGVAESALEAAEAAVAVERAELGRHTLFAPFDAVVVDRLLEPGSVLAPGQPVLVLADPETVWTEIYVDEALAGPLRVGQRATITLRSRPGETFPGRIARIGLEADRVGEERRVYIAFDHVPEAFVLGEQAEALITVSERANVANLNDRGVP